MATYFLPDWGQPYFKIGMQIGYYPLLYRTGITRMGGVVDHMRRQKVSGSKQFAPRTPIALQIAKERVCVHI